MLEPNIPHKASRQYYVKGYALHSLL